jgi:hypothetical protein
MRGPRMFEGAPILTCIFDGCRNPGSVQRMIGPENHALHRAPAAYLTYRLPELGN